MKVSAIVLVALDMVVMPVMQNLKCDQDPWHDQDSGMTKIPGVIKIQGVTMTQGLHQGPRRDQDSRCNQDLRCQGMRGPESTIYITNKVTSLRATA